MKGTKSSVNKSQRGVSLIELAFVLATVSIIVMAILKSSGTVGSSRSESDEVQALSTLVQNAKQLKSGGLYPTGTLVSLLIAEGQMPPSITVLPGGGLQNQFGGSITVSGNSSLLVVNDLSIPAYACEAVVEGLATTDSSMTLIVGGNTVAITNGGVTASAAQTACGAGTVSITFNTSS